MMGWPGPLTHRQFLCWREWEDHQWNVPSRSDHYQMSTTCQVARVLSSKPGQITVDKFRLEFVKPQPVKQMTVEEQSTLAQSVWLARLGATDQLHQLNTGLMDDGSPTTDYTYTQDT